MAKFLFLNEELENEGQLKYFGICFCRFVGGGMWGGESKRGWTRQGNYAKMDLYEFHSGEAEAIKTDTCVTNEQKTPSGDMVKKDG